MINKVLSVQEYKELTEDFRSICRRPFSNIYLMSDDIKRFIELERVSFEKSDYGLIFYFDEDTFYRVCLYVDEKQLFEIPSRDKKLLIRNVYRTKKKDVKLSYVEERLQSLGFKQEGTTAQIEGNPQELIANCKVIEQYAKKMERMGYSCIIPDISCYEEIEDMILESRVIKDYHMTFRTKEEKRNMEKGSYLCIVNEKGELCAAIIADIDVDIAQIEALAVKEEYKIRGLAPILDYKIFKQLCERKIGLVQGWVELDNDDSLRYHMSLGYRFAGKQANEWILEK